MADPTFLSSEDIQQRLKAMQELRSSLDAQRGSSSGPHIKTIQPIDTMSVDRRAVDSAPDGWRKMSGFEQTIKGIGDVGEAIYGLSGFTENWEKTKEEFKKGSLGAGQVLKTLGSFGLSLPLGLLSAPFSVVEKGYEFLTGTPTQEAEGSYIPDYNLDWDQRAAAGVDALIDAVGVGLGGTGSAIRGVGKVLGGEAVGAAFRAAKTTKALQGKWSDPLKKSLEALKDAKKSGAAVSAEQIADMEKKIRRATRREAGIEIGYDMLEEGSEEYAQSLLEDVRGTQEKHGLDESSQAKAIESAFLGALGGLVWGGAVEAASRVREKIVDKVSGLSTREEANTDWMKDVPPNETAINSVVDEMEKARANDKSNTSSGQAVGQIWTPPKGYGPQAAKMGIIPLLRRWTAEEGSTWAPLHQHFEGFEYEIEPGRKESNLSVIWSELGARAANQANGDNTKFMELWAGELSGLCAAVNDFLASKPNKGIKFFIGKNPGNGEGYVMANLIMVDTGSALHATNILDLSMVADIDGDNYGFYFVDKEGRDQNGNIPPAGSIWDSIGLMTPTQISLEGKSWRKAIQESFDKARIQCSMSERLSDRNWIYSYYDSLTPDVKSGMSQKEFNNLIDLVLDAISMPVTGEKAVNAVVKLSKDEYRTAPFHDVFSMFGWLSNSLQPELSESMMSTLWDNLTMTMEEFNAENSVSAAEIATGAASVAQKQMIVLKESEYILETPSPALSYGPISNTKGINVITEKSETGKMSRATLVNRTLEFFGAPQMCVSGITRMNLMFYTQVKSAAEAATMKYDNVEDVVEDVFSQLLRDDMFIKELGDNPMELATEAMRKVAFELASVEAARNNEPKPTSVKEIKEWCDKYLKAPWNQQKEIWDRTKKRVYGDKVLPTTDANMFTEYNEEDAILLWYECNKTKTFNELVPGSGFADTLEHYVGTYNTYRSTAEISTSIEAINIVKEIVKKQDARNVAEESRIRAELGGYVNANISLIRYLKENNFDLSTIKTGPQWGATKAFINGLSAIVRKSDLASVGILSVERMLIAAASDSSGIAGNIARCFLSGDVDTMLNGGLTLSFYNEFNNTKFRISQNGSRTITTDDGSIHFADEILKDDATDQAIQENANKLLASLVQVSKNSEVFGVVALHYFGRINRALNPAGGNPDIQAVKSVARDLVTLYSRICDTSKPISYKQEIIEKRIGKNINGSFVVGSLGKTRDPEDIATVGSRWQQYSGAFADAAIMNQEYVKTAKDSFIDKARKSKDPDKMMKRVGMLHAKSASRGVVPYLSYVVDNIQRFMPSRAKKTENTPSMGQAWKANSRAEMGFVPAEVANMAYNGMSIDWKYIEASPSLVGLMLCTDYLEENFPAVYDENGNEVGVAPLMINTPDSSNPLYVTNKWDLVRYLLPPEKRDMYPASGDKMRKWDAALIETLLEAQPLLINVFNPITYAVTETSSGVSEKAVSSYEIVGWQLEEEGESGHKNTLFSQIEDDNWGNLEQQALESQLALAALSTRDGAELFTGCFEDGFFDRPHSYEEMERATYDAYKKYIAIQKLYVTASSPKQRTEIETGLVKGSTRHQYDAAVDYLKHSYSSMQASTFITLAQNYYSMSQLMATKILSTFMDPESSFSVFFGSPGFPVVNSFADTSNLASLTGSIQNVMQSLTNGNDTMEAVALLSFLGKFENGKYNGAEFTQNGEFNLFGTFEALVQGWIGKADSFISAIEDIQRDLAAQKQSGFTGYIPLNTNTNNRSYNHFANIVNNSLNSMSVQDIDNTLASWKLGYINYKTTMSQYLNFAGIEQTLNASNIISLNSFDFIRRFYVQANDICSDLSNDEKFESFEEWFNYALNEFNPSLESAANIFVNAERPIPLKKDSFKNALDRTDKEEADVVKARLELVKNVTICIISAKFQNCLDLIGLDEKIHSTLQRSLVAAKQQYDAVGTSFRSESDESLLEEIKSGKVGLVPQSPTSRIFQNYFINEFMSGNSGTGVSLNSLPRASFLAFSHVDTHADLGGELQSIELVQKERAPYVPSYWVGKPRSEFYTWFKSLDDKEREYIVGTYEDNGISRPLTRRVIETWYGDESTLGKVFLLVSDNAGFDYRYDMPPLNGNTGYRGFDFALGMLIQKCAENMNLKSKKTADIYDVASYALQKLSSRKEVQEARIINAESLISQDANTAIAYLLDVVRKTKKQYAETCYDLYENSDKARKELAFSRPLWYMISNHLVQRICFRGADGSIFRLSVYELVNNPEAAIVKAQQAIEEMSQSGKVDGFVEISSIEGLGADLLRFISDAQSSEDLLGSSTRAINKARIQRTTEAIQTWREEQYDYEKAASSLMSALSSVSVGRRRSDLITTSGLDSSYDEAYQRYEIIDTGITVTEGDCINSINKATNNAYKELYSNASIRHPEAPYIIATISNKKEKTFIRNINGGTEWYNDDSRVVFRDNRADGHPLTIFITSDAERADIKRALRTAVRTGCFVMFDSPTAYDKFIVEGDDLNGFYDETVADGPLFCVSFGKFPNLESSLMSLPTVVQEQRLNIDIQSQFIKPADGGGRYRTFDKVEGLRKTTPIEMTVGGKILKPSEVRQLVSDRGFQTPITPDMVFSAEDMASLGIGFTQSDIQESIPKSAGVTGGEILNALNRYLRNMSALAGSNDNAYIIDPIDGYMCVGLYRETVSGGEYLKPIFIGPISGYGTVDVTYDDNKPNTIKINHKENTSGSMDRGETQKGYEQGAGTKLEKNKTGTKESPSDADLHSFYPDSHDNMSDYADITYTDSTNQSKKEPGDKQTLFASVFFWMKRLTKTPVSLFINPETLTLKPIISSESISNDALFEMMTDESKNTALCFAILNDKIEFNIGTDELNQHFKKIMRAFASRSLAVRKPLIQMVSNFTVRDGKIQTWGNYPNPLSVLPDSINAGDVALFFHTISPALLSLSTKDILVGESLPDDIGLPVFNKNGHILQYYKGEPFYTPCSISILDPDWRNSQWDNFSSIARVSEKPMTLNVLFDGVNEETDYSPLFVEASLAYGNNLDEVYTYYESHKDAGRLDLKDVAASGKQSQLAGMSYYANSSEMSDYDNVLMQLHAGDCKDNYQQFLDGKIYVYTNDASVKEEISRDTFSNRFARLEAQIDGQMDTNDRANFETWILSLVKRNLGYSPSKNAHNREKDTFTRTEIEKVFDFIEKSLIAGKAFDMSQRTTSGQTDFKWNALDDPRYIVPFTRDEDMPWLRRLKANIRGFNEDSIREQSIKDCKDLVTALENNRISSIKQTAILRLLDALTYTTYGQGQIITNWAKDSFYVLDLLTNNDEILEDLMGAEAVRRFKKYKDRTLAELERKLNAAVNRGMRSFESSVTKDGTAAIDVSQVDKSIEKLLNYLCETSKLMRILEPMLFPASVIERIVYSKPVRFMLERGMLGKASPYQSRVVAKLGGLDRVQNLLGNIKSVSHSDPMKSTFNKFKMLTLYGTTDFMMSELKNYSDINEYLNAKAQNSTLPERFANAAYDWAAGKGVGSSNQIEIFFMNLVRLMSLNDEFDIWFQPQGESGESMIEASLKDPERFFIECFSSESGLIEVAKQAYNVSMQGDAAAKTVWSIMYYETCAQHPVFRVFNTIFFSPFVQYGINIANRHLQSIAPISSINYILVALGSKSDLEIPWLTTTGGEKMRLKDLPFEDAQVASSLREAILIDMSRMGTMFVAMLIAAMSGFLEPPEDEDKWCNIDEWTILGNRIQANWWIQDVMGPALGYAAALVSVMRGKPCPQVFYRNLADCLYCDPLMRASDGIDLLFNPYGQYMEEYYNDIDRFDKAVDGSPSPLQVLGANVGIGAATTLFSFITPAIVKDIYRESQQYEASYKKIYKTDQYGNVLYDDNGVPIGTEDATYLDQKIRKATRNNPTFALVMDAIRALQGGKGTGYFADEMPRTVYYDPEQLDSFRALSLYYYDENGNIAEKPEQEKQAIALGIINTLLQYDNMDELVATGFCMPIETMKYVSDVVWDIYYSQKEIYQDMEEAGQFDPYYLGGGDYELGKTVLDGINEEFGNLYRFWSDFYYNKLWSPQMKAGIQKYNRLATSYEQDANGEWYATGFRRGLPNLIMPFRLADGTLTDPGNTMGWAGDWATPSVITGNSTGERVLVPFEEDYIKTPDFDSLGNGNNGNGYSNSYPKYMSSYGGGRSYGYSSVPRIYAPSSGSGNRMIAPDTGVRTNRPITNVDLDTYFIRPGFETKGSRKAYKREDI